MSDDQTDEVTIPASYGRGAALIVAERLRQITEEEYDADHDDGHVYGELAWAAVAYAAPDPGAVARTKIMSASGVFGDPWPWGETYDKRPPLDAPIEERIRGLTKAGAFIAAEIDRLLRVADKRMPDEVWAAVKEKFAIKPEDRERVVFYKKSSWDDPDSLALDVKERASKLGVVFGGWRKMTTRNYYVFFAFEVDSDGEG